MKNCWKCHFKHEFTSIGCLCDFEHALFQKILSSWHASRSISPLKQFTQNLGRRLGSCSKGLECQAPKTCTRMYRARLVHACFASLVHARVSRLGKFLWFPKGFASFRRVGIVQVPPSLLGSEALRNRVFPVPARFMCHVCENSASKVDRGLNRFQEV